MKHVDDKNFQELVYTSKAAIVDFWATWCGPCRQLQPVLEDLEEEFGDQINIFKYNVDENHEISSEFGIRAIPSILFFKNGKLVETKIGFINKNNFKSLIETVLLSPAETENIAQK